MKNITSLLILMLAITSMAFGQKTTVLVNTFEGDQYPVLNDISQYNTYTKYSKINEKLIVKTDFRKKDTEVWYFLLDDNNKSNYSYISTEKNKDHYVKKYGKIYKVKRKTPVLNR